MKKSNLA